jgi:hypothetical protein
MRSESKKHPAAATAIVTHEAESAAAMLRLFLEGRLLPSDGPQAFPIMEAFNRIGVGRVKGYELVNSGELQTFLIGSRRYATSEAIRTLFRRRIAISARTAAQRAEKVAKATQASLVSRRQARGGATGVRRASIQESVPGHAQE